MGYRKSLELLCVICIAFVVYGLFSVFYSDILLIHDGAYIYSQMREVLLLNLPDPLHIRFKYCGVLEQFFTVILGFFTPLGWAVMFGGVIYFVAGYFALKHLYAEELQSKLLALLLFPMPYVFTWIYCIGGEITAKTFYFFIGAYFLTHPKFRQPNGGLNYMACAGLGLAGGLAVFSYLLSKVVVMAVLMTALSVEALTLIALLRNRANQNSALKPWVFEFCKKLTIAVIAYFIGLLPYYLPMHFRPEFHASKDPVGLELALNHILQRIERFHTAMSYPFTPIFKHALILEGRSTHFSLPIKEIVIHTSVFSQIAVYAALAIIFILGGKRLWQTRGKDAFVTLLMLTCCGFFAAFALRKLDIQIFQEARFFITFYFALVLGVLYLIPRQLGGWFAYGLSALAIISYLTIINTTYKFNQEQYAKDTCESLTPDQLYSLLRAIKPEALAGPYQEIWPVAASLNHRLVYDITEKKFAHVTPEVKKSHILLMHTINSNRHDLDFVKNLRQPALGHVPTFVKAELGNFHAYFEIYDNQDWELFLTSRSLPKSANWQELISILAKEYGKTNCKFEAA